MGEESEPIGERDIVKLVLIIIVQTIILTALGDSVQEDVLR
jgi:hypothetical protein